MSARRGRTEHTRSHAARSIRPRASYLARRAALPNASVTTPSPCSYHTVSGNLRALAVEREPVTPHGVLPAVSTGLYAALLATMPRLSCSSGTHKCTSPALLRDPSKG